MSCSDKEEKQQNTIYEVNIGQAIQEKQEVQTSEFIDGNIEYVLLDSKKEYLLDQNARLYLNDGEIIAFTKKQIFVFSRKTGEFLLEIGHFGKDPGGYKKTVISFPYDEEKNIYYTSGWDQKSYYRYNSQGGFIDEIITNVVEREDDFGKNIFAEMVTSVAPLNDSTFVGYVWNINGKQETKLIVFDAKHRINTFPQNQSFEYDINKNGINVFSWEGWFYKFNNQLNFFERFTDTLYSVAATELKPRFILKQADGLEAPYTKRYLPDFDASKYFRIENLFETEKFLFFRIVYQKETYYGFYDKVEKTTKVSNNPEGFENKVDGFIPFKFYSANKHNEIIGWRDAFEVKLWFNENPEKAAKLPLHLQKLKNINESDNPVVMIAKLK
jgi:hypothetical protein